MLDAQLINWKRSGKENVTGHKPAIKEEHLKQLKASVFFSFFATVGFKKCLIPYCFLLLPKRPCRRTESSYHAPKASAIKFAVDAAGRKFAIMVHDEASKNHPGGVNDEPSNEKEARVYKTAGHYNGYKALKLYLEKINPNCSAFFQYPKANFSPEEDVWFDQRPLGVNTLANMMKKNSEAAGMS